MFYQGLGWYLVFMSSQCVLFYDLIDMFGQFVFCSLSSCPSFIFCLLCPLFHFIGGSNDALYRELWHACAGPLVTLPREGERVYYFPQGHMEQVCLPLSGICLCLSVLLVI